MPIDLDAMEQHPGSVKKRDLVAALKECGWALRRRDGKHEVWSKPGLRPILLPRSPKGTETIRASVKQIIDGEQ